MNKRLSNLNILTASDEIVNFPSQFQLYWHRVESGEYVVRFDNSVWCNQTTIFICWWYHKTLTVCNKMRRPMLSINRTIWYQSIMKAFTVEERVIGKGCLAKTEFLDVKEDNTFNPYFRSAKFQKKICFRIPISLRQGYQTARHSFCHSASLLSHLSYDF